MLAAADKPADDATKPDGISCTGAPVFKTRLYWVPNDSRVWTLAMVLKVELRPEAHRVPTDEDLSKGTVHVRTVGDGHEISFPLPDVPLHPANPSVVDDMTALFYMHEPGILANLEERAALTNQRPYTYISNVLIAVNPLRRVPGPTPAEYIGKSVSSCPPHPFGIAETAFRQLTLPSLSGQHKNQSIVISGESGAGKTETAKIVLRYLCGRSGTGSMDEDAGTLENRLMESNPILEAFGNAKTTRNHNSSRFGKFMKICFQEQAIPDGPHSSYKLSGAIIDTYLLEKSRVTSVGPEERSYHIFYQLIAGGSASLRQRLRLKEPERFRYLCEDTDCFETEGISDADEFETLRSALRTIRIDNRMQDILFRVVASVLHLGNITFHDKDTPGGVSACVDEPHTVTTVAELLGTTPAELERLLTTRQIQTVAEGSRSMTLGRASMTTNTEMITKTLDAQAASYKRDGFAKALYSSLFDWIVKRVGFALSGGHDNSQSAFIGILDIFGFECFETNGFEQLLINFANESLQRTFNRAVLDAEQDLYLSEGLGVEKIEYADNSECVDLMWSNTRDYRGVLHLLEETSEVSKKMNQATSDDDERFCSLLHSKLRGKPHFPRPHPRNIRTTFIVAHFAGAVQYNVANFVAKNIDVIPVELPALAKSSTMEGDLLVHLLGTPEDIAELAHKRRLMSDSVAVEELRVSITQEDVAGESFESNPSPKAMTPPNSKGSRRTSGRRASLLKPDKNIFSVMGKRTTQATSPKQQTREQQRYGRNNRMKKAKQKGLAIKFGNQIAQLTGVLDACNCSFIRCVKPNAGMTVGVFDPHYVVEQLRSLGIIQTCGVLKQGLPTRVSYAELDARYRPRLSPVTRSFFEAQGPRTLTEALLWAFRVPPGVYYLGKSRIFFRYGKIEFLDELLALDMSSPRGVEMIKRLHKWLARRRWRRAYCIIKCRHRFLRHHRASQIRIASAVKIQSAWRGYAASSKYKNSRLQRRRWRVAFLKVQIQRFFVRDFLLIREARRMREEAEEESRRAAEEAKQREEAVRRAAQRKGSHGRIQLLEERKNMAAAVAASSLATVSVCLLRWQKADLFRAMEKWMEVTNMERQGAVAQFLKGKGGEDEDAISEIGFDGVTFRAQEMSNTLLAEGDITYAEEIFENFAHRPEIREFFDQAEIAVYFHGDAKMLSPRRSILEPAPHPAIDEEASVTEADSKSSDTSDSRSNQASTNSLFRLFAPISSDKSKKDKKEKKEKSKSSTPKRQSASVQSPVTPTLGSKRTPLRRSRISPAGRSVRVKSMFIPASQLHRASASVGQETFFSAHGNVQLALPNGDLLANQTTRESSMWSFTLGQPGKPGTAKRSRSTHSPMAKKASMPLEEVDPQHHHTMSASQGGVRFSEANAFAPPRISTVKSFMSDERRRKSMTFADLRLGDNKARTLRFGERLGEPCSIKGCPRPATHGVSIRFCEMHYLEFRKQFKESQAEKEDSEQTDTLQKQIDLLKRQLEAAGEQPAEFVDLETARKNMHEAVQRLMEGDEAAEKDIERWDKAIRMNPEYQEEQEREKKAWLESERPKWEESLRIMRGFVPPDIFSMSLPTLKAVTMPSGEPLPTAFAKRLWSKKILWLVRAHPDNIRKYHIADLRGKYSFQGLDIVEMRAVALAIPDEFDNDGDGKKAEWRDMLIQKLKELCDKDAKNDLRGPAKRNNCYKTLEDVQIFDPDAELILFTVTKSTAFDATEQPVFDKAEGNSVAALRGNLFGGGSPTEDTRRASDDLPTRPPTSQEGYLHCMQDEKWVLLYFNLTGPDLCAFETKSQCGRSKPKLKVVIQVSALPETEDAILEGQEIASPRTTEANRKKANQDHSEDFYLDEDSNVEGKSNCFTVCTMGEKFVFSAENEEDKLGWLDALKDAFRWAKMGNSSDGSVGNPMYTPSSPRHSRDNSASGPLESKRPGMLKQFKGQNFRFKGRKSPEKIEKAGNPGSPMGTDMLAAIQAKAAQRIGASGGESGKPKLRKGNQGFRALPSTYEASMQRPT